MDHIMEPPVHELDPETQAICDEVCGALEWFDAAVPGSHEPAMAQNFGRKWWIALRNTGDAHCRQRIVDCCDAIVRADAELTITIQGQMFTREQIDTYGGRESFVVDSMTGETRRMIEWPTGRYAGGAWSYEKPENSY